MTRTSRPFASTVPGCASSPCTTLDDLLRDSGFEVAARYGGWEREPLEAASAEIVTVANAAGG